MIARYFRVATKLKIREMSGKLKTVKENSGNFSKFSGKLEYLALKKSTAFSSKNTVMPVYIKIIMFQRRSYFRNKQL